MDDIKVFACPTAECFTGEICDELKIEMGKISYKKFSNDNSFVQILETVRGKNVYVVQTTTSPVNERVMELLITIDALKRASAERINVIKVNTKITKKGKINFTNLGNKIFT